MVKRRKRWVKYIILFGIMTSKLYSSWNCLLIYCFPKNEKNFHSVFHLLNNVGKFFGKVRFCTQNKWYSNKWGVCHYRNPFKSSSAFVPSSFKFTQLLITYLFLTLNFLQYSYELNSYYQYVVINYNSIIYLTNLIY